MSMNELVLKYVMRPQRMFTPAANVADAMSVLLELDSRGWFWSMHRNDDHGRRYYIELFRLVGDVYEGHTGFGDSMTHVICEAAVKACGATDDEVRDANR